MKALIIDDSPFDLTLITNLVRQTSELEVIAFSSSSDALRWCRSKEVDLVIVDCLMPSPSGIEFVYLFRKIRGKSEIPIIMVTASEEKEIKYQALDIGVNFFVKKPIDTIEFFVIINNAISMRINQRRIKEREAQLAESEEKFRVLAEKLPNIIILVRDGQIIYANEICEKTIGIKREDLYACRLSELSRRYIAPESLEAVRHIIQSLETSREIPPQEISLHLSEGRELIVLISSARLYYGGKHATIFICTDITHQKEIENDLRESRRKLTTLINNLPGIAFRRKNDKNWSMQYMSEGCVDILGYKPEEIINNNNLAYNDLIVETDRESVWEQVQKSLNDRTHYVIEYKVIDKKGNVKWLWEKGIGVYSADNSLIAIEGFIMDITERKESERRLQHLAHFDALTGLANRTLFFDRLHQAIRMAKRGSYLIALLFLDLDGFKVINDTYGHYAGDAILQETAKRLMENVRESDTIARIGGDEFTVILSKIENKKSASVVARKIIDTIARPYTINNVTCSMSVSIGISVYCPDGEDVDTLIKKADIAMYRAKQLGKNCFEFYNR